jgi:hypothetical protein
MMEAARTSETSVDNYFARQYVPEDNSELADVFVFHGVNPISVPYSIKLLICF